MEGTELLEGWEGDGGQVDGDASYRRRVDDVEWCWMRRVETPVLKNRSSRRRG